MSGKERRKEIIQYLSRNQEPVSGTALAQEFGVSRQVIVQDIALLRSANVDILSTNRGYLVQEDAQNHISRVFKCCHSDDETEDELNCIVDQGGIVDNVFVNHKIYGKIEGEMNIRSRRDVKEFMKGIHSGKSTLLKNITSDYHYHTVYAETEEILDAIEMELQERGYLIIRNDVPVASV